MARGRVGGGERRSCLYRPIGVGIRRNGRLVPAAHFRREPSRGSTTRGAWRSEGLVGGEHVPDRLGQLPAEVDLADLGSALAAEPALGVLVALLVERVLAGVHRRLEEPPAQIARAVL